MLLELGLRNFKAFGETEQKAPLSKITLIYGPNSGGKSSIIQALLMLKQSALLAGDSATIWGLITRGEYIDLGSYPALLHNHDLQQDLGISLVFNLTESQLSVDMTFVGVVDFDERGAERQEDSATLSQLTYRLLSDRMPLLEATLKNDIGSWWRTQISVGGLSFVRKILDFTIERQLLPELKVIELEAALERNASQLSEREHGIIRERVRLREIERSRAQQQFSDSEIELEKENMEALTQEIDPQLVQALEHFMDLGQLWDLKTIPISFTEQLSSLRYLGPLRSYPERLYKIPGVDSFFSGLHGEFMHHRLYYQPGLVGVVNDWFARFEIPYELEVQTIGDIAVSGEHIVLTLIDRNSKTRVTLADVGFGINQVLPVIVEGADFFIGGEDRVLCVEQPEIHLHPRLQAHLADLMIETISGRSQKQWIVETHSELLILRLQRRIREGKLSNSDVSVLYVDPDRSDVDGSVIQQLRLNDNGDFVDDWPSGFFEESFTELLS